MEEMNADQVVDIPDTPDRLAARRINGVHFGNESNSSVSGHLRKYDFMDEEGLNQARPSSRRLVRENGRNRRLRFHSRRNPIYVDEFEPCNKAIAFSPSENSHPSAPLFRRTEKVNNPKPETEDSIGAQHMDRRKTECSKILFKAPVRVEDNASHGQLKNLLDEKTREGQISSNGGSSLHAGPVSSRISSKSFKGKEKIDANTCTGSGLAINHGKGMDPSGGSQHKIEKEMPASHISVTSPRVTGQKRLVRNGCISPHNIASRAPQPATNIRVGSLSGEQNHARNMVSDGLSPVDIREMVAEDNNCQRAKGKGPMIRPFTSKEHDANIIHVSTSNSVINKEAANETGDACRDASLGGWRSTHNQAKKMYHPLCDMDRNFLGRDDDARCSAIEQHENRVVNRDNGSASERRHVENALKKRHKKRGLSSRNHGDWSTMVPDDLEILFLGSSGESSTSRSSRVQNRQHQGILAQIYEIDELSPEMRDRDCQGGSMNNEDSDARARQVESDEILARELQEQLYHEVPISGEDEQVDDEYLAWALQQEEGTFSAASGQNRPVLQLGSSLRRHSYRQPQPRSSRNPSNRRATQARLPTTRVPQLRNRLFPPPPTALSRGRNNFPAASSRGLNFQFPLGMDLDMRLDILEQLEATLTAGHILQFQDDFNENDYEMLLALDENNPQHGASVNQINSLPESVVQTDNPEETCAICLEAPTAGETIRHLPCLHKFHKDCIDPWLSRRTLCPVCKSSIT